MKLVIENFVPGLKIYIYIYVCVTRFERSRLPHTQQVCVEAGCLECSGDLQMAPPPLAKQTAGCNSPHDWQPFINRGSVLATQNF